MDREVNAFVIVMAWRGWWQMMQPRADHMQWKVRNKCNNECLNWMKINHWVESRSIMPTAHKSNQPHAHSANTSAFEWRWRIYWNSVICLSAIFSSSFFISLWLDTRLSTAQNANGHNTMMKWTGQLFSSMFQLTIDDRNFDFSSRPIRVLAASMLFSNRTPFSAAKWVEILLSEWTSLFFFNSNSKLHRIRFLEFLRVFVWKDKKR